MTERIQNFLDELERHDDERYEILIGLRNGIRRDYPGLDEVFRYGGLLYEDGARAVFGLFARRGHVTVELVGAAYLDDPHGFLRGRGTVEGRRHLRVTTVAQIESMRVAEYLDLTWNAR